VVSVVACLISLKVIRQFVSDLLRLPIRFLLKCFSFIVQQLVKLRYIKN
jgi:hypothetical protein